MAEARRAPRDRAELLAAITTSWNACVALIDTLSDEQWTSGADDQGWTVKDHVAHVTAWENVVTEVFRSGSPQYVTLQMSEAEWATGGIAGADAVIQARKAGQSLRRVMNNRDVTHARLVSILTDVPDEALQRPFSEFGAVDADRSVLVEMTDYLVRRYDELSVSVETITGAGAS